MTRYFPASLFLALTLTAAPLRSQTPSKIYVGFEQKTVMTEYTMDGQATNTFVLSAMAPTGAIVTNDGKIYVSQYGNPSFSFQVFDPAGHPTTTHIPKFPGQTYSIGLSASGNIYFGSESDGIFYFTPSGKRVSLKIPLASGPAHIAIDQSGKIYVASELSGYVKVYDATGKEVGPTITAGLQTPRAIAVAPDGTIYVANFTNVTSYSPDGKQKTTLNHANGYEVFTPRAITVDSAGKVYVGYYNFGGVGIFNPDGSLAKFFPTERYVKAIAVH